MRPMVGKHFLQTLTPNKRADSPEQEALQASDTGLACPKLQHTLTPPLQCPGFHLRGLLLSHANPTKVQKMPALPSANPKLVP